MPIENKIKNPLFDTKTNSLTRLVTINIADSLTKIVSSIESDETKNLLIDSHTISSNFCDSIYAFYDDEGDDIEFKFKFKCSPKFPYENQKIIVKKDCFCKINDFSNYLKESCSKTISGTFMATVETLNGDFDDNANKRCGEVTLSLFSNEDEDHKKMFIARANLDIKQYKKACTVHNNANKFLKVTGKIRPGKIKYFEHISEFKIV